MRVSQLEMKARFKEQGVTMVEMAILMPLLLLLALALTEFTFWLTANNIANSAAQRIASGLASGPDMDNACDTCQFAPGTPACNAEKADCLVRRQQQIDAARIVGRTLVESTPFFSNVPGSQDRARSFISNANDNPEVEGDLPNNNGIDIDLPTPGAAETLKAAFQRVPIEVTVRATRISFLPDWIGGNVTVMGRARAWKEPSVIRSNPARLDCTGNIIINPATAITTGCGCATDPNDPTKVATSPGSASCSCVANRVPIGGTNVADPAVNCGCPNNNYVETANYSCECKPCQGTLITTDCSCIPCGDGTEFNGVNGCRPCLCPPGQVDQGSTGGVCNVIYCESCQGNTVPDASNHCVCPTAAALNCPADKYVAFDPDTNTCGCEECTNPTEHPNAAQTACVCDEAAMIALCNSQNKRYLGACTCDSNACPANYVADGGSCRCDTARAPAICIKNDEYLYSYGALVCECRGCEHGTPNADKTQCECVSADFCPPNEIHDFNTCSCSTCTNGSVRTDPTTCDCPTCPTGQGIVTGIGLDGKKSCSCEDCDDDGDNEVVGANGYCRCPVENAGTLCPNGVLNPQTCQCEPCLPTQVSINNVCQCPLGFSCQLPLVPSTTTPCSCECPQGTELRTCFENRNLQGCVNLATACQAGPNDCLCGTGGGYEK